jgi:hypothetical protein
MQGAKKGILEESDHIRLSGLLKSQDGAGLEAKFGAKLGRNLANEPLKGQLAEEEFGALLVLPDLPEGDGARMVAVCFLHEACLVCQVGGDLLATHRLPWGFARTIGRRAVRGGSVLAACHNVGSG